MRDAEEKGFVGLSRFVVLEKADGFVGEAFGYVFTFWSIFEVFDEIGVVGSVVASCLSWRTHFARTFVEIESLIDGPRFFLGAVAEVPFSEITGMVAGLLKGFREC